jgi:pyridinium-3,5-biscarboxylic acid mononucleotide synthase
MPEKPIYSKPMAVLAAGTSDLQVAEEAVLTARMLGQDVWTLYDVGVAGLHRLLKELSWLQEMRVLVVVAGVDGALPGVVGGLFSCPVIAVPTRVG